MIISHEAAQAKGVSQRKNNGGYIMFKQLILGVMLGTSCFGLPVNDCISSQLNQTFSLNKKPGVQLHSSNSTSTNNLSRGLGFGLSLPSLNMSMIGYFPLPTKELEVFFLASVKLSPIEGSDNYYDRSETYAGQTLGDSRLKIKKESTILGGGIGFGIAPMLKLFVGGGFRIEDEYAEYYDSFEILSSDGHYWVNGDSGRSTSFNGIGGCVIRPGNPMYEIFAFATLPSFDAHIGVSFVF